MKKVIITVIGSDAVGIIAKVSTYLYENNINILDISQTILQGYFHMVMFADISGSAIGFDQLADQLAYLGKTIGMDIQVQNEEIFQMMHRI